MLSYLEENTITLTRLYKNSLICSEIIKLQSTQQKEYHTILNEKVKEISLQTEKFIHQSVEPKNMDTIRKFSKMCVSIHESTKLICDTLKTCNTLKSLYEFTFQTNYFETILLDVKEYRKCLSDRFLFLLTTLKTIDDNDETIKNLNSLSIYISRITNDINIY